MSANLRPEEDLGTALRDLRDRVRRLENASTLSLGPWVLEVDDDEALVVRHAPTGEVTVLASP